MSSNQSRGRRTTRETILREHDQLAPLAKLVSMYAWQKIDAESAAFIAWGKAQTPAGIEAAFALHDRLLAEDTWRDYGPAHPQAPAELAGKRPPKGAWWAAPARERRA